MVPVNETPADDPVAATAVDAHVDAATARAPRLATGVEVALVLGVSLGRSAVYAVLSLLELITRAPIKGSQVILNGDTTPDRPWLDLSYQIAGIVFPVVPAFLAIYLLWLSHGRVGSLIGLDFRRFGEDLAWGLLIAAGIGIPGLGVYVGAKQLGLSVTIVAGNLGAHWWTIPTYIGQAAMNGILEEVVMIGYLLTRLRDVKWPWWAAIGLSALIRGAYHLYQGFGGFIGNAIMGALFGAWFAKTRRVMPLVIAHTLLDIVSYIGYALAAPYLPWLH